LRRRKIVRSFPKASSHPSTILAPNLPMTVSPSSSKSWVTPLPAYQETNPQNLTIVARAGWTYPDFEACEEKAGLSLNCRHAFDSLG
jgi:hypothetical protein